MQSGGNVTNDLKVQVYNEQDGMNKCRQLGYPVKIQADWVIHGYTRIAYDDVDAAQFLREALSLSPTHTVTLTRVEVEHDPPTAEE